MLNKNFFGAIQDLRIKLTSLINTGKPPIEIVLELAKSIGELSGENSYYQITREQILAIYGIALHDKFILDDELFDIKARLEKIYVAYKSSEFTEEERIRIGYALESHKKEIERLERLRNS